MQIIFRGDHTTEEAAESLLGILKLFKERYGIEHFRQLDLNVNLLNGQGEDVELIDANTSEVLGVFEIYKTAESAKEQLKQPKLKLIIDNTDSKQK